MAKTLIVQLTCDRCKVETGETVEGSETTTFGYDGYSYSLDLCKPHAADFHNSLQGLITWSSDRSRLAGGRRPRANATDGAATTDGGSARRSTGDRERLKAIREWARKNGHPNLGDRGRIPYAVTEEYDAAMK